MAGERYVHGFCGGAGGVSDIGEPGPSGGDGWVWAVVDAHDWGGVRDRDFVGSFVADSGVRESCYACDSVCGAYDFAHGGVAACGKPEDGGAAGADGVDSGDGGG